MTAKPGHRNVALTTVAGMTMIATMVAPATASIATPVDADTASASAGQGQASSAVVAGNQVTSDTVVGDFSYTQSMITPNDQIARYFRGTSDIICGATNDFAQDNPLDWRLSVSGDVGNYYTASVDELMSEESVDRIMTCTCGGNPAGGRAIITADVKGIPIEHLLSRAGVEPGANTVTFISADGTQVSFSLGYVIGHHALLSYEINGEDLSASVGGNNQLWMTRTAANYFVRDVVEVVVSTLPDPPADPGTYDSHPNSPNVAVLSGAQE
jgi:DMSO/TMAO reductase YedYZ molybdopterin-dependent catalytic subunit